MLKLRWSHLSRSEVVSLVLRVSFLGQVLTLRARLLLRVSYLVIVADAVSTLVVLVIGQFTLRGGQPRLAGLLVARRVAALRAHVAPGPGNHAQS